MGVNIPHYVREFNAASMAEAIHLADQALREEGVTVAVWRDRIKRPTNKRNIFNFTIDSLQSEVGTHQSDARFICYQNSIIDNTSGWRGEKVVGNKISDLGYLDNDSLVVFEADEIAEINNFFSTAHSFLRVDINNEDGFTVHQDEMSFYPPVNEGDLFFGGVARMLENLEGSPTEFYLNEAREDPYRLPLGAASFTLSRQFSDKSAWHDSTPSHGKVRIVHMVNLCVSPL